MTTLTGYDAIAYAEANELTLCKYEDPTEEAAEGLSIADAKLVAQEDANLIYLDADLTGRYQVRIVRSEQLGAVLFVSDDAAEAKRFADENGSLHYYGVAIADTQENTVDWGDRVTGLR
jgi:hypothetical protein